MKVKKTKMWELMPKFFYNTKCGEWKKKTTQIKKKLNYIYKTKKKHGFNKRAWIIYTLQLMFF